MERLLVVVFLTLLVAPAIAAEEPPRSAAVPQATIHITPEEVMWETQLEQELVLTIARPDGVVLRRDFTARQSPSFSVFDSAGQHLPDGAYTYELRTARELRPGHSLLLSGSLAIHDGSFVDAASLAERVGKGPKSVFEADQVIQDKLIVQGNACIGHTCQDGEGIGGGGQGVLKLKSRSPFIELEDIDDDIPPTESTHDWWIAINGVEDAFKILEFDYPTDFSSVPFYLTGGAPNFSVFVGSNGNVGLGTSTPVTRLDVRASASGAATGRVQNSSATGYSGFEYLDESSTVISYLGTDNAANNTRFNSIQNHPIVILTESVERARVTSAGSVGIGTSTPSSKLHVSGGDIRVSGGSFIDDGVTLNAPDYVFEPDYELMPLAELAAFVRTEKHLPNVPKAAEIKASGLNLSQFQMRLLEKIEELTLYALAQQEEIADLRAKVEMLEAK